MKKILINLKDWLNYYENVDFAMQIDGLENITVFPSLPYLHIYKDKKIKIGSQKISSYESGAHTGSISAEHLKDFDVTAVILNHRECQIDDIEKIEAKINNAKKLSIDVILCIGTIAKEDLNKIKRVLNDVDTKKIYIAYEPIEALEIEEIKINLDYIKKELADYDVSYIYGSNITTENFRVYDRELDVDGFLISSHALNVDNLKKILEMAK